MKKKIGFESYNETKNPCGREYQFIPSSTIFGWKEGRRNNIHDLVKKSDCKWVRYSKKVPIKEITTRRTRTAIRGHDTDFITRHDTDFITLTSGRSKNTCIFGFFSFSLLT